MRTQHNFCTQQVRYVGITRIVILFGLNLVILFWGEVGKFRSPRVIPREWVRSPKFESRHGKLLRDGCACAARVKLGMSNVCRVNLTDI